MDGLTALSNFLDNYWARSQVFRALQFSSAMLSGLVEARYPVCSEKLMVLSGEISNLRIMLRLLDDLPVLAQVITAWRKAQQCSLFQKWVELVNITCTQLYYPVEHLAWAADKKIIAWNSTRLWTIGVILWGLPLLTTLIHKLKLLFISTTKFHHILSDKRETSCNLQQQKLSPQQLELLVDIVQVLCDLSLAIHWMPRGVLWGERLPAVWWGLFGTISSVIGLYKLRVI